MGRLFNQHTSCVNTLYSPPNASRVAWRALAMHAVCNRGYNELAFHETGKAVVHAPPPLPDWVIHLASDLVEVLAPHELSPLETALGCLNYNLVAQSTWLCEGLAVLWWALGLLPHPSWDPVVPLRVLAIPVDPISLASNAKLLPLRDFQTYAENLATWQWRFTELLDKGIEKLNLPEACVEHDFIYNQLPLIEGDLAIAGGSFWKNHVYIHTDDYPLVANERLRAAKWLCGFHPNYWDIEV